MSLQIQADELQEKTAGFISGTTKFIKNVAGRGADLAKQQDIISKSIKSYGQSRGTMKNMANNLNASVAKQEAIGKNMYDINLRSNNLLKTKAKRERSGYQGPASWIKGKVKTVDINMTRNRLAGDMRKANKALDAEKLNHANYTEAYSKANQERATHYATAKNAKGAIKEIKDDVSTARKRLAIGVGTLGLAGTGAYTAMQPKQEYQQPYYQPQQYQQMPYKTAGLASFGTKMLNGIKATGVDAKAAYSLGKDTKNFAGAAKMFGSYHPVATFSGGALAGVGAIKAFSPSNPNPVNKQASFAEKIAKFVEDYDYPEDYMEQMATPNEKPNNMLYLGAGALGVPVGGLLGGAYGSIFNKAGKGALIGAGLLGGAALYKAHSVNKDRKVWSNNPKLFKKHLQDEWDNEAIPYLRSKEKEYADAVKNNILNSTRLSLGEVAGGIGTAAHVGSAVSHHNKNEKSDRNFDATMGALHAASTYNAYQKRQDNKSYRDKYLSLTPAQRTALDHEIRTAWRKLSAGEREDEGFRVSIGEPSAFIHAINRY